jgi:hypothetical protein
LASASGGSPAAATAGRPSSRSAAPFWSSSGTCYPNRPPATPTSAPASTTPGSAIAARCTTSPPTRSH